MRHDSVEKAPEEQGVDMTELMAAVAMLNEEEPPVGRVIVSNSIFPVSEQIKKKRKRKTF